MASNPYKIALVGGGQLGSRYLQGIVRSFLDVDLYIVDPSNDSLKICHDRILEVNPTYDIGKINNFYSVDELPLSLDLVIVATTANIRWKVVSDLFKFDREVTYAILEKVLFQREIEYLQCEVLLRENNVRAWVNCPRRLMPIYSKLRTVVAGKLNEVVVTGGAWGLASNTIHFIDIISFISSHDDISIVTCDILHPSESISKRPSFYETFGSMTGVCGDVEFKFSSEHGQGTSHLIQLETDDLSITVDEIAGEVSFLKDDLVTIAKFEMPLQSDVSGALAESILLHGTCGLTPYSASAKLHLPFIRCINDTFRTQYNEEICPLT
jgi:predicted dehydrogenase|tara:strand:- start:3657 stop:4631 length:975 start_codon:yes stop_codon:yes gene_type:complete